MHLLWDILSYAGPLYGGLGGVGTGGLVINLALALCAIPLSLLAGLLVGAVRIMRVPVLASLFAVYTEVAKAVPLVLGIFWFYYASPTMFGVELSLFATATVALVFFGSANIGEVVRSGWNMVRREEMESAALAGLSRRDTWLLIVAPQIAQLMAPALLGVSVSLFKDTALVFVIGVVELTQTGMTIANRYPDKLTAIYILIGLGYFVVCTLVSRIAGRLRGLGGGRAARCEALMS